MAYQRQGLQNGDVVYAENVDLIEDGIIENEQNTATNEKNIEDNEKAIGDLQETKADKSEIPDLSELTEQVETNKTNISSLTASVSEKADQSDVDSLKTQVQTNTGDISSLQTEIAKKANSSDLAKVATSGSYNDLTDTPDLTKYASAEDVTSLQKDVEQNTNDIKDLKENGTGSGVSDELVKQVEKNTNDISTIKKTINTLHPSSAVAIYTADGTLTFDITYDATLIPEIGDTYNGSEIVNVYTGFKDTVYTSYSSVPWYSDRRNFTTVVFTDSFENIKPIGTAYWFYSMTNLTEIKGLEYLDTSVVTNMNYMFFSCSGLTSLDVSNFNTSAVTSMNSMFYNCRGLTSLDVSSFDTSAVTNMGSMFNNCSGLTSLDVSNFNTSAVTGMNYMFNSCSGLTSLDVSNFNTSAVTSMESMFYECSGLTSLDVSNFGTSKVTSMSYMFQSCSGLTSLDVSNFDTSAVTDMSYMFYSCSGLTTIYSDDGNFVTTKVTSGNDMFRNCSNLVGGNGSTISTTGTTYEYAHVDTEVNPGLFTQSPNVSPTTLFNEMHDLVLELAEIAVNNGDLELLDVPANLQNELRVKLDDSKWKDK